MPSMVRRCTKDDIDSFVDLSGYAYSIPESTFERFREKWEDIFGEFFINEVNGIPVAAARMIPLVQNIRSTMKPMGAIGLVAGSPEHRRRGYVRDLMSSMLKDIRKEGYSVSCLYPFKDTFYGVMNYVKMPPSQSLEFNPVHLKNIENPEGYSTSRESGDDAFSVWRMLHEHMVNSTHGAAKRRDIRWKEYTKNFSRKIAVARNQNCAPEGVMIYSIKGYGEGHSWAEPGEINIGEMYWNSLEARDSLLNFVYGHTDQITKVKIQISSINDDYYHWLSDMHTPVISSRIISMARVINLESAILDIPSSLSGTALIQVIDPFLPENNGVFRLTVENGRFFADREDVETSTTLSIEGLTSLLYGTLNQTHLKRMGWLKGEEIPILDEWFPRRIPWLSEDF